MKPSSSGDRQRAIEVLRAFVDRKVCVVGERPELHAALEALSVSPLHPSIVHLLVTINGWRCGVPVERLIEACEAWEMDGKPGLDAGLPAPGTAVDVVRDAASPGDLSALEAAIASVPPLPRCLHGKALRDHGGELLEPPCGCRLPAEGDALDLDAIEARANAATPGPWQTMSNRSTLVHVETQPGFAHAAGIPVCSIPKKRAADAAFIADARADVVALVAEVRRLRAASPPIVETGERMQRDARPLAGETFEQAWARMEKQGYQYGEEALEQVRFGWELARAERVTAARIRSLITKAPTGEGTT